MALILLIFVISWYQTNNSNTCSNIIFVVSKYTPSKITYFVSTFWKYRPFSETNYILLCWNLLSSRWAHRTRALHQLSVGGRKRSWIIYCWLIWYERKILFWLKIYDRLHQNKQDVCFSDVTNERMHYIVNVLAPHACKCKVPELT